MSRISIEESRNWCHELMRSAAKNFYHGMSALPAPKRNAMFALYAFMRHIDDIADDAVDAGTEKATAAAQLRQWQAATHAALAGEEPQHIMFPSLREAMHRFCIPPDLLDSAIDGQLQDLQGCRYTDFDQLRRYCYCVASTVGIAAVYIWGFRDSRAIELANDRGIAFQLTNILRDIREDFSRGRTYLPENELAQYHVILGQELKGRPSAGFTELMQFQIARAESFYASSSQLELLVEADARPTLRTMTAIYHGILKKIARDPAVVLQKKVRLSAMQKAGEAIRQLWLADQLRIAGEA
jgi:15-cis-phytoene synthase